MRNYSFLSCIENVDNPKKNYDCVQVFELSMDFYKYEISEIYYNYIFEIRQVLNNSKNLLTEEIIKTIIMNSRCNLSFTNLLSEMYSNVLFLLVLLDTFQIIKYKNIRQTNIKFLQNYLILFDESNFNEIIHKNYNIFKENKKYYLINRKKNRQFYWHVLLKFLLARCVFKKLFFETLKKRYTPLCSGYYDAKSSFEKLITAKYIN
jgi:hypothetical protein